MWKVSKQNNYITAQQGPECTTMTRELCLQAENTLYSGDGEWGRGEGGGWECSLVDEHKVHGPLRQEGEIKDVCWEKAEGKKKVFYKILIRVYLLTSRHNQLLSVGVSARKSNNLCLTDNHVHAPQAPTQKLTHASICITTWQERKWRVRRKCKYPCRTNTLVI